MNSFKINVLEFNKFMEEASTLRAIDLFYADYIQQIENNDPPIVGKDHLPALEEKNIANVKWFKIVVERLLIDEENEIVMGELNINFETTSNKNKNLSEAFVQKWELDKICYQRFYYKEIVDAG